MPARTYEVPRSPVEKSLRRTAALRHSAWITVRAMREGARLLSSPNARRQIERHAGRIETCLTSTHVRVVTPPGGVTRITTMNKRSCRSRCCAPCCRYHAYQMRKVIYPLIEEVWAIEPGARALMLTLTTKNVTCTPTSAVAMMKLHEAGLKRFFKKKLIKDAILGQLGSIEITVGTSPAGPTVHVHSHHLLIVNGTTYFRPFARLRQEQFRDAWRDAAQLPYNPVVDIRVARTRDGQTDMGAAKSASREVVKYLTNAFLVDPTDHVGPDPIAVLSVIAATHRRRLTRYDGIFATAKKRLRSRARAGTHTPSGA
jgi:hypothetical protein